MGQVAEDMVDGTCCDSCGCYFRDAKDKLYTHEHPATCWDCWADLTDEEKEHHTKAVTDTF